jgi:hypothetical protein
VKNYLASVDYTEDIVGLNGLVISLVFLKDKILEYDDKK